MLQGKNVDIENFIFYCCYLDVLLNVPFYCYLVFFNSLPHELLPKFLVQARIY